MLIYILWQTETTAIRVNYLGNKDTATSNSLDLFLSLTGEELCLDNDWLLGKVTLAQNLVVTLEKGFV